MCTVNNMKGVSGMRVQQTDEFSLRDLTFLHASREQCVLFIFTERRQQTNGYTASRRTQPLKEARDKGGCPAFVWRAC